MFRESVALAITLCFALSMFAGESSMAKLKVDHASICASQLEPLRAAFGNAGLTTDYGGPHATGGTHMALLGFENGSYLELIAPMIPGAANDSPWGKMIASDAGTCAWAIGTRDIQAEAMRLKQAGVPVEGPAPGSRKRPDGQTIEWQTAQLGTGGAGSVLPFMIQDKTARELRVKPSASVQGSQLSGISVVVIGVKDLDDSIALFRKAFGLPAPKTEEQKNFGARLAYFPGTSVILATPLSNDAWLARRLEAYGNSPVAFLLGTNNSAEAAKRFALIDRGTWFGKNVQWFDPDKLHGVRLGVIEQ
jgi:catechol 2,3-dioxygenase-like lactoylglutathione lyase family enzyme